jgi:hypothetical protein
MKKSHMTRSATAALAMTAMSLAVGQTVQSELHRDAATRNVGGDPFMTQYARAFYCNLPDDNNQIVIASRGWNNTTGTGANAQYRIPLTQIFDDVWFIGNHYVGQYLIKTADGLVEVDAGNTANEVQTFNYPAMQTLGLSASYPLKAVFLTHGHGDHDGGAKWLLDNLGARSYLGSADAAGKSYAPVTIDSTDLSMRQMSIGGKTFWVLPTPGHTPGATSAGAGSEGLGQDRARADQRRSVDDQLDPAGGAIPRFDRAHLCHGHGLNVEGVMTPHIYWDGEGAKLNEINATGRTNPSQHVYGHDNVLRQLAVASRVLRGVAHPPRHDRRSSRVALQYPRIRGRKPDADEGRSQADERMGACGESEGHLLGWQERRCVHGDNQCRGCRVVCRPPASPAQG